VIFVKKLISHVCACAWYKADFKERLLVKKLISHICACAWYKADFKERLLVKKHYHYSNISCDLFTLHCDSVIVEIVMN
jgi:trehalose utilization protein